VFGFRPPEAALVLAVVELPLELVPLELLDPQPAANRSAAQAMSVEKALFMVPATLA
jgi:hypothetical protein